MEPKHKEILSNVFLGVLEQFAFLFGDPGEEGMEPMLEEPYAHAFMSFAGAFGGRISVAVPVSLCNEVAANVLGLEPDEDEALEKSTDAIKEMLNITCGHMLTELAGCEPVFELSPPTVKMLDSVEAASLACDPDGLTLLVDNKPLFLTFALESPVS